MEQSTITRAGILVFDENCTLNRKETFKNLKARLIRDRNSVLNPTTGRILELEYALEMALSFLSDAWRKEQEGEICLYEIDN